MTQSSWLRMLAIAGTLALGGVAAAQSGGGTDPDRDTGRPAGSKMTTGAQKGQSSSIPRSGDAHTRSAASKRSRDLENSPGGSDETTVPKSEARHP